RGIRGWTSEAALPEFALGSWRSDATGARPSFGRRALAARLPTIMPGFPRSAFLYTVHRTMTLAPLSGLLAVAALVVLSGCEGSTSAASGGPSGAPPPLEVHVLEVRPER